MERFLVVQQGRFRLQHIPETSTLYDKRQEEMSCRNAVRCGQRIEDKRRNADSLKHAGRQRVLRGSMGAAPQKSAIRRKDAKGMCDIGQYVLFRQVLG